MPQNVESKPIDAGTECQVKHSRPMHMYLALSHAVEDGIEAARRAVKRTRYAADDLVEEAAHSIKRRPLEAVALSFGLAFGVGALVGWVASRACRN